MLLKADEIRLWEECVVAALGVKELGVYPGHDAAREAVRFADAIIEARRERLYQKS